MKHTILALTLLCPLVASATTASASLSIKIVIPSVFNIVDQQPTEGGMMVTADTNMREITMNGALIKFGAPGRQTFFVPTANGNQDGLTITNP